MRKILNPVLKLFFNPNPLIRVLNMQTALNGYSRGRSPGSAVSA